MCITEMPIIQILKHASVILWAGVGNHCPASCPGWAVAFSRGLCVDRLSRQDKITLSARSKKNK